MPFCVSTPLNYRMDSKLNSCELNSQAYSSFLLVLPPLILLAMQPAIALPTLSPKTRPQRPKSYSQATELQAILHATVLDKDTKPADRASCARAWEVLEERKRILRGRPLPGHLRPDLPASQRKPTKRVALLAEPLDEKESLS
jgi:hypothetical protein